MSDFLDALKAEISSLEAELAADPRLAKLQSLRSVLALYEANGKARDGDEIESGAAPARAITRVPSEARAKAMELAEMFVRNRASPTPTREILEYIQEFGGDIGGRDPVSNLSAMLSNSDSFQSHGRAGWTLIDPDARSLEEQTVSEVVDLVLADLTAEQIDQAADLYNGNEKVQSDLDARLLSETRRLINRHLTNDEMRKLRSQFGRALVDMSRHGARRP